MNGVSNYIRINISLPSDLVKELKKKVASRGMSKFISDATREKVEKEKRDRAFRELLEGPPAFTEIKDSVSYVRKMRRLDEKRMKRLGI